MIPFVQKTWFVWCIVLESREWRCSEPKAKLINWGDFK